MYPDMFDLLTAIASGDLDAIDFARDMADIADMNGDGFTAEFLTHAADAGRKLNAVNASLGWMN